MKDERLQRPPTSTQRRCFPVIHRHFEQELYPFSGAISALPGSAHIVQKLNLSRSNSLARSNDRSMSISGCSFFKIPKTSEGSTEKYGMLKAIGGLSITHE